MRFHLNHKELIFLIVLSIIFFLFRFYLVLNDDQIISDEVFYLDVSNNIRDGHGLSSRALSYGYRFNYQDYTAKYYPAFYAKPFYNVILAGILFFWDNPMAVQLSSALLLSLLTFPIYILSRNLFTPVVGAIASMFSFFIPHLIIQSSQIMADPLALLILFMCLIMILPEIKQPILLGFGIGLLYATKQEYAIIMGLLVIAIIIKSFFEQGKKYQKYKIIKSASSLFIAASIVVIPIIMWNLSIYGVVDTYFAKSIPYVQPNISVDYIRSAIGIFAENIQIILAEIGVFLFFVPFGLKKRFSHWALLSIVLLNIGFQILYGFIHVKTRFIEFSLLLLLIIGSNGLWFSLRHIQKIIKKSRVLGMLVVFALVLLLGVQAHLIADEYVKEEYNDIRVEKISYNRAAKPSAWLAEHSAPDAIVLVSGSVYDYAWYSKRRSISYLNIYSFDSIKEILRQFNESYILVNYASYRIEELNRAYINDSLPGFTRVYSDSYEYKGNTRKVTLYRYNN